MKVLSVLLLGAIVAAATAQSGVPVCLNGCVVNNYYFNVGDTLSFDGVCGYYVCETGHSQSGYPVAVLQTCPIGQYQGNDQYVVSGNLSLPFPYCCDSAADQNGDQQQQPQPQYGNQQQQPQYGNQQQQPQYGNQQQQPQYGNQLQQQRPQYRNQQQQPQYGNQQGSPQVGNVQQLRRIPQPQQAQNQRSSGRY